MSAAALRVAYVVEVPVDERDYHRLGMQAMVEAGLAVEVVDVTAVTRPGWRDPRVLPDGFPGMTIHRIGGLGDLGRVQRLLSQADRVIMVAGFTGAWRSLLLYRALSRSKTPYLVMATNAYPGGSGAAPARSRLAAIMRRLRAGEFDPLRSLLFRVPNRMLGVRAPKWAVLGGERSRAGLNMYPVDADTRLIWAHSFDYDIYRSMRGDSAREDVAVFIDENMGFQRDLAAQGLGPMVETDAYYRNLRALFDRIEAELGLKVVIAANPRAEEEKRAGAFGQREVVKGGTAALIARSRLVVAHRSTAVGYAVMFRVPVLLCSMRALRDHWLNVVAYGEFERALGKPVQLFDRPEEVDLTGALELDRNAYDRYMQDYVKVSGSPDLEFWHLVRRETGL